MKFLILAALNHLFIDSLRIGCQLLSGFINLDISQAEQDIGAADNHHNQHQPQIHDN